MKTGLLLRLFAICTVGHALDCASASQPSNSPAAWPSLAEVRQKWGDTSFDVIERAAENGDLTAQHYLGFSYAEGERISKDAKKALACYERAGKAGYAPSFNNIGVIYQKGQLVPPDLAKAMLYYRRAADAGFASSQFRVGAFYANGV